MTAPATGQACAAPGCPRAQVGGRLCPWHAAKLGQALADIAADLIGDSSPSTTAWRTDGGGSGTLASERDPINLRLIDAQRQAPPVLAVWADWLCGQRSDLSRPGWPEGDRKLLATNLRWILGTDQADRFWCDIRALWASLRGHLPVRRCTCGGPVWFDRGGGWCSWCGTPWSGAALLELPKAEEAA